MRIIYQKNFMDQFSKLSKHQKQLTKEAVELFAENQAHESLHNHPLRGKRSSYRSITTDDDLRLHYRIISKEVVMFIAVGSHQQLYRS